MTPLLSFARATRGARGRIRKGRGLDPGGAAPRIRLWPPEATPALCAILSLSGDALYHPFGENLLDVQPAHGEARKQRRPKGAAAVCRYPARPRGETADAPVPSE